MLQSLIPGFIYWLRFEKRYSPHTLTSYEKDLAQLDAYLTRYYPELEEIGSLSHHHIRSWLAALKEEQYMATTLNHKISVLSSFYRHLQRQGIVAENPVRKLHSLRVPERLPVYLKEENTQELLDEADFAPGFKGRTDRLICELLYHTGMRRQELINIRISDIEWSLRQLRVLGKGNKERLLPLSEAMLDTLRDYIAAKAELAAADGERLLVLESGKPLYAGYVYRVVRDSIGRVSSLQKRSPHVMRHTFATHLLSNGANIQAIKELLGHSSLAATQVYTHNSIEKLKEVHRAAHPRGGGKENKPKGEAKKN